jgi:hypothetical protein
MLIRSGKGVYMYGNANAHDATEADAQLLVVTVSDEDLERAAVVCTNGPELTLAYCTLDWACPF